MNGFLENSEQQLFFGIIGAIDGYLQPIAKPRKKDCDGFPQAYWSEHYMSNGLNVQAVCDSNCYFLYFGVVAPGKCTKLFQIVSNLCPGQYIVCDVAYTLTDQVLFPFIGSQKESTNKDAYSYFLSQFCIRNEMIFGLLTNKWMITRTSLSFRMKKSVAIISACAHFHNFCLLMDDDKKKELANGMEFLTSLELADPMPNAPLGWAYLPTVRKLDVIQGTSQIWQIILDIVTNNWVWATSS
jgi:hypothetical protein